MQGEELIELKFRLYDGSDIGPVRYVSNSTVAMLKERIVSDWPKDKKIAPKVANDVKLISAGKILENNKTIDQCKPPFGELPEGIITMHVVVQPSSTKTKAGPQDWIGKGHVAGGLYLFDVPSSVVCADMKLDPFELPFQLGHP
ncbi:membrane-anchored ubiquitin-fold protein 4-like [Iris pallida]|uniref:Membrane-anchored ubiquitin-fold protein 4-like n=1 Tax=Iris pallida TaxID=29817 RepID=A0AAX6I4U4_IRIPA|nr:membrane-anchored ubiquitin-fold protein 4-like [Iris pallida]